ncbi:MULTISPECIES: hypothetical protein [unclassified Flavobacterium]|uniref:hypothetical protein n=1 Tax=unclassified Flavobacterium TaxID=196869 RepID=UPI000F0CF74F|nr:MULTISPECIES: hypothetical protein [unclassified Flavobacterium]AYN04056.1 hypothetical protein EAG11_07510 [Flavobacterium sp. 140616W15]MCD0476543.1 hypothetical protein [Flavobacterium sp. EDS]
MATDGVKIIDGDTAHDTYWGIMDLYDNGVEFDIIDKEFPLIQSDYFDDFDNEIYVTSCALALWEMGVLTDEKLAYVKSIIDKAACVREWTKNNEKDGKARKKELDKFWKKISQTNTKIRARKKYRKITNFYFQSDDLLTFKLKDGNYRAVICTAIEQYRGQCNYILVPTTYNSSKKPTIDNLKDKEILGRQIGSGYDQRTTKEMQPGIERIWNFSGGNCNFFFGVIQLAITHKDFINFKERFEKVGTLRIIDGLKKMGSFGYEEDFERFETIFSDLENHIKIFQQKKYPVTILCDI